MDQQVSRAVPPITESDLRLLRIFRAVAEAGGLTAAEGKLGMERSTISRHLQALEARLGARLCLRGPAGFELTDFGERALKASIAACDALDVVRHELNLARGILIGDLEVGVADNCLSNPRSRLADVMRRFRGLAPDVTLKLSIGLPDELVGDVLDRKLHLAISGLTPGIPKLDHRSLFTEEFRLYVAAGDGPAPTVAELPSLGYTLVTRTNDRRTQNLADQLGLAGHAVAFGLEAVATMLVAGGYVGFIPVHYALMLEPLYRLIEVRDAEPFRYTTQFALVTVAGRPMLPSGRLFARLLAEAHARGAAEPAFEPYAVPAL
jgi:DNA-binding transcriptional LysR family regulator